MVIINHAKLTKGLAQRNWDYPTIHFNYSYILAYGNLSPDIQNSQEVKGGQ